MSKHIVVVGHGPGISHAVAEKFGAAGFSVALVARSGDKLQAAVERLAAKDIKAAAFTADAGDPAAVRHAIAEARKTFGPITVLHWNVSVQAAGDLLTAPVEDLRHALDGTAVALVAAVQETLADLRKAPDEAAVLVTNGGLGMFHDVVDTIAVQNKTMGLGVANAAKHKVTRLIAQALAPDKVFVGEVMVAATVKGTAWDRGQGTLEASVVAERFWQLYTARGEHFVVVR